MSGLEDYSLETVDTAGNPTSAFVVEPGKPGYNEARGTDHKAAAIIIYE